MKSLLIAFCIFAFNQAAHARVIISEGVQVIDVGHRHLALLGQSKDLIIDHVSSLGFEIYGPAGLKDHLKQMNIDFVELAKPSVDRGATYVSSAEIQKKLITISKKYPDLIQLTEIGKSVKGQPLTFARITAPEKQGKPTQNRPKFKYIANMHGDEIVGRELMMSLIDDLASHYGKDNRITSILENYQIFILPSMNPDGADAKTRYNAHGVDLNRSFPDFTTSDNINSPSTREPEIQAVMRFQAKHQFKLSANFHGGAEVVNYPWDAQAAPFPLDNLVKKISLDYAKKVPYIYGSTEFPQGITNGFAWYIVQGGMQDWSYHWHNDIQVTIELTQKKWPAFGTVTKTYQDNRDALLTFIEDTSLIP